MTQEQKRVIKGYELREKIGAGGFGAVYRAFQPAVGREVAIKVILAEYANQPEFIRRFETEAQMVARLEHPHIVPLYDYWREPDGAYLVMRWLRGGSLRASLRSGGPWQPEAASLMFDQIAAALTIAHRNGVIHRDLKPDNILLDEEGNAYLADFGIAKDTTQTSDGSRASLIIGSPDYMSPEQVRGDPLASASDIYSLGIVLYETLTGVRPFPDLTPTALMLKQLNDVLPPLSMKRPDLPEEVDDVIATATDKDPAKRYKDAIAMAVAFRQAVGITSALNLTDAMSARSGSSAQVTEVATSDAPHPTPAPGVYTPGTTAGAPARNPFKGLRAFQSADAADFYGRDSLIAQLLSRMTSDGDTSRFLAVVGPSGSGKSSVVKAGLLPKIREGAIPGSDKWFIVELTPGARPYEELEIALLRIAVNPPTSLMEQLQADDRGLLRAVSRVLPTQDSTLMLVIDQFEEVFTQLESEAVRRQFLTSLLTAIQQSKGNLRVVITLRADFYDKPLLYADFGHLFRRCTEVVLPLNRDELQEAITKPARGAGLGLEPGLVEAIVKDVGEQPGALPLLQYALTELFQRKRGNLLTLDAYHEINGAMGALARRAEQTYVELDETCQKAARQIFLRLVTLGEGTEDTRRRVRQDELMSLTADTTAVQNVLDTYGKYRLLTFDRDPLTRVPTVEVAHEALIRSWDRLKGWLNTSREAMRMQRALSTSAEEWRRNNRDSGYLMSGTRLSQFEEWATGTDVALSTDERAYLDASLAERQRLDAAEAERKQREALIARRAQNFGRAAAVLGVVGVLAVVATILAFVQANRASEQVATATVAQGQAIIEQQTSVAREATATVAQGLAIFDQQTAVAREVTANAQVAIVGETLTPVAPTLTSVGGTLIAVGATLEAGNAQIATATYAQGAALNDVGTAVANANAANFTLTPIPITLTAVSQQLAEGAIQLETATAAYGEAQAEVIIAQEQARIVAETLTPVAPTLTAVGATLEAGNAQLATAFAAQNEANIIAGLAQTEAAEVAALLTPVPVTLTAVAAEVEEGEIRAEALRLVSEGNNLLQGENGNAELAALLSIRALNIRYLPLADDVLVEASSQLYTRQLFGDASAAMWYASLSPDRRTVVTSSDDGALRLWDSVNGMLLRTIPTFDVVWNVTFAPDGQTFVAVFTDGSVVMYETATGDIVERYSGHRAAVYSVAFSPDGSEMVTGAGDGTAIVWDVSSGREVMTLRGHTNTIYSVAWSPDGAHIATGSRDTTAVIWDADSGDALFYLYGHTNAVYGVAFSPNGRLLLTGGDDDVARLWDVRDGEELRQLTGHTSGILSVAFSPDGRTVATSSRDQTARLWDIEQRAEVRRLSGHTDSVWSVTFSTDGRSVITASSDGTSRLWNAAIDDVPRQYIGHTGEVLAAAISPDTQIVATGSDDNTVRLWNRSTGETLHILTHPNWIRSVAFSPDGRLLASGSDDGTVRIWDTVSGVQLTSLGQEPGVVYGVAFSPDSSRILAGYSTGRVFVWEVETGERVLALNSGAESIVSVAYAPDGQSIAGGGIDALVRVWDLNGSLTHALQGHTNTVYGLAFTPDSRYVVSASSDNMIRKWNLDTNETVLRITGHTGTVWSMSVSADNRYLLSSSSDNTARLWDAQTGQEIRRFSGHTGTIWSTAISSDSRFVITASRDQTARLWDVDVDETISYVCSRLRRELTAVERTRYSISDTRATCPQFSPADFVAMTTPTPDASAPTSTLAPEFGVRVADAEAAEVEARGIDRDAVRVFGPTGGLLYHNPESSQVVQNSARITVRDFIAQATVTVPYDGNWDFAFFFRQNDNGHYRLIVDSDRNYALLLYDINGGLSGTLESGRIPDWNLDEGETNFIQLVVSGGEADVYINRSYVTTLDVSVRQAAGQVSVITSAYSGYSRAGAATRYDGFTVWSLDGISGGAPVAGAATATQIPEYATRAAFSGTATVIAPTQLAAVRATAEAIIVDAVPIFGPLNGELVHDAESTSVVAQPLPVSPADLIVQGRFYNPYSLERGNWDFAIFFRDNDAGQYRLVISSDQSWELKTYSGDNESTVGGQLLNLNVDEGGANTIRLVAEGERGALYLNDEFISALDLSANTEPGELMIVTGAYVGTLITGEITRFEELTVWSPRSVEMTPTPTPALEATAERGANEGHLDVGARDRWAYAARGGELVDIYTEAEWDTLLMLRAPDGTILAINDDTPRGGLTSLIERFVFPVAGTYFIEVRGYQDTEGGDYTLNIIDSPTATPTPVPSATVAPTGIAEFGENEGEIEVGGADLWQFAGAAGQVITVETDADWDTVVTIYNANGLAIASNDDSPFGGTVSYIGDLELSATETYTIEVRGYNNQAGGGYTLIISEGG